MSCLVVQQLVVIVRSPLMPSTCRESFWDLASVLCDPTPGVVGSVKVFDEWNQVMDYSFCCAQTAQEPTRQIPSCHTPFYCYNLFANMG